MAFNPSTLYSAASIPIAKTDVVVAETATKRIIRKATFTNISGGALTFDLYFDPTGGSEVQLLDTKSLADMETYSCPDIEGHVLEPGGTIALVASAANISCVISGTKVNT